MLQENAFPALVLNADYRPLTVAPLSTWTWQDAIKGKVAGVVDVIAEYDHTVRSARAEIRLPSVIALKTYVNQHRPAGFNRWNVFVAYGFRCNYCGERFATNELTFEHVVPSSRGGRTDWSNIVPACEPCNHAKGNKTLAQTKLRLRRPIYHPTIAQLNDAAAKLGVRRSDVHKTWLDHLYWFGDLES